ncbi:MAG: hypothetical protein LLF81_08645 [Porphyromonadaceae bacterium]|nr:hypothetical protein [Porphyromonadaceae bacterium]
MNKTIFILAMLVCVFSTNIFSQNAMKNSTPEERAKIQTEWMIKSLQLTDSQKNTVEALNLEYAMKMENLKNLEGKRQKMKEARKISNEKDEKLKTILNEQQYQLYIDNRKELMKKIKERSGEKKNS